MIAVPLIMLLGIWACGAGNVWWGMALFWIVSLIVFAAITFAPNRWFIARSRYSQREIVRRVAHNAAYGG